MGTHGVLYQGNRLTLVSVLIVSEIRFHEISINYLAMPCNRWSAGMKTLFKDVLGFSLTSQNASKRMTSSACTKKRRKSSGLKSYSHLSRGLVFYSSVRHNFDEHVDNIHWCSGCTSLSNCTPHTLHPFEWRPLGSCDAFHTVHSLPTN